MASVYFGTAVVTVPDDTYQLKDILDALQLTEGIIRRRGGDGQIVATMPFETLPSFDEVDEYEVVVPQGPSPSSAQPLDAVVTAEDADSIRSLLLSANKASSAADPNTAGHSDDGTAYIRSTLGETYTPHTFSQSSHTVYASSVYDPRRTASTSLEDRLRPQQLRGNPYFAAVDRYRPSAMLHTNNDVPA
jgi:hypothetical protein